MTKDNLLQITGGNFVRFATPDDYQPIYRNAIETINATLGALAKIKARRKPKDAKAHAKKIADLECDIKQSLLIADAIGDAYTWSVLRTFIDPKRIRDDEYIERVRYPKLNRLKPGKRNERDRRIGLPKKFWRWTHRYKTDELSRHTGEPIPIELIDEWHEEWKKLPPEKQDAYEIAKPLGEYASSGDTADTDL